MCKLIQIKTQSKAISNKFKINPKTVSNLIDDSVIVLKNDTSPKIQKEGYMNKKSSIEIVCAAKL